jgi:hypothetical protein
MIVITNRDFIAAFSMLNASEEVDKYRKHINIAKVVGKQIKNLKWSNSFCKRRRLQ